VLTAPLHELQAELLLPLLCSTGRLYLEVEERKASRPLLFDAGQPWDLSFELSRDEEVGECVLKGQLVRGEDKLALDEPWLFVGGGWFLTETTVARLAAHGGLHWAEELRRNGPLRAPLDEESNLLRTLLEARGTPIVTAAGVRWVSDAVPKPVLWVGRKAPRSEGLDARLFFEYQGLRVRSSDDAALLKLPGGDGSIATLIHRDFDAERERAEQLLASNGVEAAEFGPERDARVDPVKLVDLVRRLLDLGWTVDAEGLRWRRSGELRYRVQSQNRFFELGGGMDFEGQTASFPALLEAARQKSRTVKLGDGSIGILPEKWLEDWSLFERLGEAGEDTLRFERSQAWLLDALLAGREGVTLDREFTQLRDRVLRFEGLKEREVPEGFRGELRPYQRETLAWLAFLEELGIGGCLADDMGLGKTVQILAHLEGRRASAGKSTKPTLVVAPRSLCFHWMREAAQFTPEIRCLEFTGTDRKARLARIAQHDLVVTTYGTVRQDIEKLSKFDFDCVVLDEAQAIKNPLSLAARAVRLLKAGSRIALTGTPVENHLGDLWSIFEFLNPGMLGSVGALRSIDSRSALPPTDESALKRLSAALKPFVLRRTKQQVLVDLPSKTEQTLLCALEGRQRSEYDELHAHYRRALNSGELGEHGVDAHVLEALLRLRQAACHPGLLDPNRVGDSSAKLETLLSMLEEVTDAGHKALVFSQFTSFLSILRANLDARGWNYEYLDGATQDRGARVEHFQTDARCTLFLISLKAGGFGLNLTAADYVFLLDPWWNPAVEMQAIDRVHRIGQTRSVMAYRLVARGTIEERVLELQARKRVVAESLLGADKQSPSTLSRADLELLFT
jgi:superfamily II DNA or RNA helicase